jgi:Uri superfamily endonuclease
VRNATLDSLTHPARGTYALILRIDSGLNLQVGKLGAFYFHAGFYVYIGSAMGSGGLGGRLKHHLAPIRNPHWHVDYLRQAARLEEVWCVKSDRRREHAWASALLSVPGAAVPVPRFGASDCSCTSHLFHFVLSPPFHKFQAVMEGLFPCDGLMCRQDINDLRS